MASGDVVGIILDELPLSNNQATLDVRAGGSTPPEMITVYDFDAASSRYLDYKCQLQGYDSGGLTVHIRWMASSATSGVCRWGVAIRRIADDAEDVDVSHTYDFNYTEPTTASASGEVDYATVTFTDGADMDSLADGENFILRITRDGGHANDTMTGDAELFGVMVLET
jgi:hypothetical protein